MTEKLNILHLEDNDNDAELVQGELEKEFTEYDYLRVDNETDFTDSLLKNRYNLVISDYSLPAYDGLKALEKTRILQPDIPFILVSGTQGEDAAVESMKNGATDYVLKNRLNKLVPTIIRAIEQVKEKSRRKRAEDKYGKLIESARDVIFTLSSKGIILTLNKAFETITGLSRYDWEGKSFKGLLHPEDFKLAMENLAITLSGKILDGYELRFLNSEGSYLYGELLTTPLFYTDSEIEILGVVRDITERKKSEQSIRNSLKEKEILLKEIHHRVKNNLQIVTSLLKLQSAGVDDKLLQEKFRETQSRIMTMSFIHESFYKSNDLSRIEFNSYLKRLAGNLFSIYVSDTDRVKCIIDAQGVDITVDTAIPCGLIINEIISNSLKYAFPDGAAGIIKISLKKEGKDYILTVSDNGKGFEKNIDSKKTGSMGLVLINMLCEQIEGKITHSTNNGTEYKIVFPSEIYTDRLGEIAV